MSSKTVKIFILILSLLALTIPSSAQTAPSEAQISSFATINLTSPSMMIGETSTVAINLNNVPAEGLASAEFTCTYNSAVVEVSAITPANLFGADPVVVVNDPQNGSFVFAIAGSVGNKATTDGAAFTFSAKGLLLGQSAIDCQARVSTGNLVLVTIPSTPASLDVKDIITTPVLGTLAGQVLASKPVTVTLTDSNGSIAGSVTANVDGSFSHAVPAGIYTAVASAPGHLRAQGSVTITNGNTTTLQLIKLPAGDIDGNDVIDQFDALTIGINYNGTTPDAADLNNDGTINVLELEILAPNYRRSGPIAVSHVGSPVATSSPVSNPTVTPSATIIPSASLTPTTPPGATHTPHVQPTSTPSAPGTAFTSMQSCHAPGAHDGLNPHEHGDCAPSWANQFSRQNFGHPVVFGGDERSSDTENTHKHQAFKGFTATVGGLEMFVRYHAASNPADRAAAFHSYEVYARDQAGNVSFWQGVYFAGYPDIKTQRMTRADEAIARDSFIISSPDIADWNRFLRCEQWYTTGGLWSWDIGILMCDATTRFHYGEHLEAVQDTSTWDKTGAVGLQRLIQFVQYGPANPRVRGIAVPVDRWYCVSRFPRENKPNAPTWTVTGAVSGPDACDAGFLPQFKAGTFPAAGIWFETPGGNQREKTFPGAGVVEAPN